MLSGSEAKREYLTVEEVKRLIATPCRRDDMKAAFLFSCFAVCALWTSKLVLEHISKTGTGGR